MSTIIINDEYLFLLEDKNHRFTIGLSDVIDCIKAAEKFGNVPELPNSWWLDNKDIWTDNTTWLGTLMKEKENVSAQEIPESASYTGESHEISSEYTFESMIFFFKDNTGTIQIGLRVILLCFNLICGLGKYAGIPDYWWWGVINRYKL